MTRATTSVFPHLDSIRIARFWSYVDQRGPDECWEWKGGRNKDGYGNFRLANRRTVTASRLSLILTSHQEPAGQHVLHRCDNPPCCNPAHLFFGSVTENNADKLAKGRARTGDQSGAANGAAKLTDDDLAAVVARLQAGWTNVAIAADLPVTHSMVSKIRRGHMWQQQAESLGWLGKGAEYIAERRPI